MKHYNLFLLTICFCSHSVLAQEPNDEIDDSWGELQQCLDKNTVDFIDNKADVKALLFKNKNQNQYDYIKTIANGYKLSIKDITEDSLTKAVQKLPAIKKKTTKKWEILYYLESLFIHYFEKGYIDYYGITYCRKVDAFEDYPEYKQFIDLNRLLSGTIDLIQYQNEIVLGKCCLKNECIKYYELDYLFIGAVMNYQPKLKKYISKRVLDKKREVILSNDVEKIIDSKFLFEILE